jgi:hypothetical protein
MTELTISRKEQVESLAIEWLSIIRMSRTNQQLEGWMMKLGIGKATVEHPLYSKNAKGNQTLIKETCVEAGLVDCDGKPQVQRIYDCVKMYGEIKLGEDIPSLAGRLQAKWGSVRAFLKGDTDITAVTESTTSQKCLHCKVHCPQ